MTQAQEQEFRMFLEGVIWQGRPLTEKAIAARITKAKQAEEILGMDIEVIVASDEAMRRALIDLRPVDTRGNLANAVRKYYEMRHGRVFPRLLEIEEQRDMLRNLVYVCEQGKQAPVDGIVFFGEGYGDSNRIALDDKFEQTDCFVYDCGEHAPYRYALYCCEFESPWSQLEKLLALGMHSIIVVFSKGLPHACVARILGKLREHGYSLSRRRALDGKVHPQLWTTAVAR